MILDTYFSLPPLREPSDRVSHGGTFGDLRLARAGGGETTKLYADVANQANSLINKLKVRVWSGLGTAVRSLVQWIS